MTTILRTIGVATLAVVLSASTMTHAQSSAFENFVTRRGDQLVEGDRPLRFVSFNIPNLLVIEDAFEFLGESPWRWPDEFEIADALETVRQIGGRVARSYVLSVQREGSDMGECVHVLGPGEFNEEAFATLDLVMKIANEKQIRVIIPLVDNWKWMGGAGQYAAFRGKQEQDFWTDRQLIDDFKQTIKYVVNRRNTLTGQLYCEDKAILGWETGNELDAPPAWTAEIAAYLKQLDANHLVIDGRSLHGASPESLADPNVDVVTTHHYPEAGVDVVERITAAAKSTRGRKPYFVGEVGFIPVEEARRVFDAVAESNAAGALYWSLRFHRREGGFYWHSEPAGANLFKAYHWPGFAMGDEYNEAEILQLVSDFARRVSPSPPADDAAVQPPRLLPIEHPGRISWQGSTGATTYDVERAPSASGPWKTIAKNVDGAATQYRPLFCDVSAEPGKACYYRVTARMPSGAAALSNIVGPVVVDHKLLVDELQDESLIHRIEGSAKRRTDNTRRVQEDVHRIELEPHSALIYKLPARVTALSVWIFSADGTPDCQISASADGESFTPLTAIASTNQRGKGDYGYMRPLLLQANVESPDARFLKIANNAGQSAKATFEISRIEISYALQ